MPLAKAFLFCGWRVLPIDWSLDPGHDLSNPVRQQALEAPMRSAAFTAAALDCSTKSRAREIPRTFADGRPGPKPLRSEAYPEGLPGLDPKNQRRVDVDNAACSWILKELQAIADNAREPGSKPPLVPTAGGDHDGIRPLVRYDVLGMRFHVSAL